MANIAIKLVPEILFLAFNRAKIYFANFKLTLRTYTPNKVLLITKQVQIIDQKFFATAILALEKKVFIVYMVYLRYKILIYLTYKA